MFKTPTANITHITIFGDRNAGKSSLFNAILNQDIAIVDETLGTTTDPVHKRIELLPFGPVLLTDTAGMDDFGDLGAKRVEKVRKMFSRTHFGIVAIDATSPNDNHKVEEELKSYQIPFVRVYTKIDLLDETQLSELKASNSSALFVSVKSFHSVINLKESIIKLLNTTQEKSIVGKYLDKGDNVVLVVPIDSEAPKGRLILPQVQVIRDLLDYGMNALVTNEEQLPSLIKSTENIKLVITDSQAFHKVKLLVPDNIYLTSFSILFAHFKSNISNYSLSLPSEINSVLICESCTHNVGHEDIGMVKIPRLLKARYGEEIKITHVMGNDFDNNVSKYDLIIHCGSCMLGDSVMKYRINLAKSHGVPFINYGLYLAFESRILEKSLQFFKDKKIF